MFKRPQLVNRQINREQATGVDGVVLNEVARRDKFWWHYPGLRTLNLLLLGAICCDITNGYDGSMLNGLQILPQWQEFFNHPKGGRLGLISNGTRIGQAGAIITIAPILQKFGRRKPIIFGSAFMLIGIALQTAAQNLPMFVIGRVIIGLGNNIQQSASLVLLAEIAYPPQRPAVLGIMNTTGSVGQILAAWITFGTGLHLASSWSWRLPSLLQACSSLFQLTMGIMMPESPRWLIYNNRREEARKILVKYHAEGNEDDEMLKLELAEIDQALEFEKLQRTSSWLEWFRTSANRHRFLIVLTLGFIMQWCGNAIISYYLHLLLDSIGIKGTKTQLYINGGNTISGFCFGIFWSLVIDRFGRRFMFLTGMTGMFCAFLLLTVFTGVNQSHNFSNPNLASGTVAMVFIFFAFYKMAGVTQEPYFMEISPYRLRAKTTAIKQFGDAGANLFSGFVNPIALEQIKWKYYIVWCCVLVTNFIIIYFFYPETKGLSLEEVTQMFDGNEIHRKDTEDEDEQARGEKAAPVTMVEDRATG